MDGKLLKETDVTEPESPNAHKVPTETSVSQLKPAPPRWIQGVSDHSNFNGVHNNDFR